MPQSPPPDEAAIFAQLQEVFRDVFDQPALSIRPEMTAADVEDWDSLTHINLIVATERAFHLKFTTNEVHGMKNVGEFVRLIAHKSRS